MKFFIDSADVKEIRIANDMGCVDGVTTNPSLLAKVGRPLEETIREICSIVDGPISAEAVSMTAPDLIADLRRDPIRPSPPRHLGSARQGPPRAPATGRCQPSPRRPGRRCARVAPRRG